jgi:hypothetical protein
LQKNQPARGAKPRAGFFVNPAGIHGASKFVVFPVRANPSPDKRIRVTVITDDSIMVANSGRPKIFSEGFEMKRRVTGICQP